MTPTLPAVNEPSASSASAPIPAAPPAIETHDAALAGPDPLDITALVQQIHAGSLDAGSLTVEVRRQCVACLTTDGFSTLEIAQLLHLPERTIRRDRAAVRQEEAIGPSLTLGDELLGEYQRFALASIQRLIRFCRDSENPPYSRLWAEESISRIYHRFIDAARQLQYVDDGVLRLRRLRDLDPAEQDAEFKQKQAEKQRLQRWLRV